MSESRPISIFLSHRRDDAGEVRQLQEVIEAHGLGTWRDLRDLPLGSQSEAAIVRVIEHETEGFLLYLTKRALGPGFIWDVEVPAAMRRRVSEADYPIIPLARGMSWRQIAARAAELGFPVIGDSTGFAVPGRLPRRGMAASPETTRTFVKASERMLRSAFPAGLRRAGRDRSYEPRVALLTDPANPEGDLDLVLDWRPMYSGRRPSRQEWDEILVPALRTVQEILATAPIARTINVPLFARLPAAMAFGYAFRLVTNIRVVVETRGRMWDSAIRGDDSEPLVERPRSGPEGAQDVSVEVSISEDVTGEATGALVRAGVSARRRLQLAPAAGASTASVRDAVHGATMVEQVVRLLRELRRDSSVRTIHLFLAGPAPLALFLGRHLNGLGPIQTYQRADDGGDHVPAWFLPRKP